MKQGKEISVFSGLHIEVDENKELKWIVFDGDKSYNGCWNYKTITDEEIGVIIKMLEDTIPDYSEQ